MRSTEYPGHYGASNTQWKIVFTPIVAKQKHPGCCKFMRMRRSLMSTNIEGSHWNRGKASCWKWVLKFTLHPMEIWAGKRIYSNNSITSQQIGALFIGFIGIRKVYFCAKLFGAARSTSKDIRTCTWSESVGLACWTKRSKVTKGGKYQLSGAITRKWGDKNSRALGPSESLVQTFRVAPVSSRSVKVRLGSNLQCKVGMEYLIFWPLITRLFLIRLSRNLKRLQSASIPTRRHNPGCGQLFSTGTMGRQTFNKKHSYAYSSQTKAPRVLQIYAHAQIIKVYKHKG